MLPLALLACAVVALALAFAVTNFANAGHSTGEAFGLSSVSSASVVEKDDVTTTAVLSEKTSMTFDSRESSAIATSTTRDISKGVQAIADEQEAARRAAEEARRAEERAKIQQAETNRANCDSDALGQLSYVDFSVGKEAFIAEWAARIDAYLSGSPLAGQGTTFATAAWNSGVDPRWSPAISNTESGKGTHCFLSHNAWGWGQVSFSNWEDAISTHVAGLASGYGFTISMACAYTYCPPNSWNWYYNTLGEMQKI